MKIMSFEREHILRFLELASREGWIVAPWELDYILNSFPQGCFCGCDEDGAPIGFVTAVKHSSSGWIGNLVVDPRVRGGGAGSALFDMACKSLAEAGCKTLWLTASAMGKRLYEKRGFKKMDTIYRFKGVTPARVKTRILPKVPVTADILSLDAEGWGESRHQLLQSAFDYGISISAARGFLCLQPVAESVQIGPFAALDYSDASDLLYQALEALLPETVFFSDTPAGNSSAMRLYKSKGITICGENELMYAGEKPDYRPEVIYGLATMGSCG